MTSNQSITHKPEQEFIVSKKTLKQLEKDDF